MKAIKLRTSICRWALAWAISGVSLASVAQTERIALPDLGASANSVITPKEERDYAKALVRQMRSLNVLIDDPQIAAFFQDMGYRIVAQSDRPEKPFTFVVLDNPVINAFAAPGGVVALHTGLILAAETEDEVAGVLSHEVAHVTQLHLYRAFERARSMSLPLALAMLGLILAGGGDSDVVQAAVYGSSAIAQQQQINFTRQNEHEADRIGIKTLAAAGYDPVGMADFFSKLGRLTRANGEGPPEFLRTHPVTTTRIAEAKNRAAALPTQARQENKQFFVMQARIRALSEQYPETAIDYFRKQLQREELNSQRQEANRYGLSLALNRIGEYSQASELSQILLNNDPNNLAYRLLRTELALENAEHRQAVSELGRLYHSFPGNHAIAMHYATALLRSKNTAEAETASVILRQQLLSNDQEPALYDLYARAADIAGDQVRSIEAVAESYYLRGGLHEAIQQLERLPKEQALDYYQRARINARLREMRIEFAELNRGQLPGEAPPRRR